MIDQGDTIFRYRRHHGAGMHQDLVSEKAYVHFHRVAYHHREWLEDHRRQVEKRRRESDRAA